MEKENKPMQYKYVFRNKYNDVRISFQSGDIPEAIMKLGKHINTVNDWRMYRFKLKNKKEKVKKI